MSPSQVTIFATDVAHLYPSSGLFSKMLALIALLPAVWSTMCHIILSMFSVSSWESNSLRWFSPNSPPKEISHLMMSLQTDSSISSSRCKWTVTSRQIYAHNCISCLLVHQQCTGCSPMSFPYRFLILAKFQCSVTSQRFRIGKTYLYSRNKLSFVFYWLRW